MWLDMSILGSRSDGPQRTCEKNTPLMGQVACGMLLQRLFDLCPQARGVRHHYSTSLTMTYVV